MTSERPDITVLILNYNSWEETTVYIHSLRKQKDIQLSFLVVDNCSPDNSYEKLRDNFRDNDDVKVIQSEYNGGYAYGNNYGLKYLENEINEDTLVLISNNDIEIDNDQLLKRLAEDFYLCRDIAFISPVMYIDEQPAINFAWKIPGLKYDINTVVGFNREKANKVIYYRLPENKTLFPVDCLPGSFFLGKLNTFRQLNYFDERTFLYEEERILAQKVKNAGLCNYIAPDLKFHHKISSVINKEVSNYKRLSHLLNSRIVFHKYYAGTNVFKVALLRLIYSSYLFARRIKLLIKDSK